MYEGPKNLDSTDDYLSDSELWNPDLYQSEQVANVRPAIPVAARREAPSRVSKEASSSEPDDKETEVKSSHGKNEVVQIPQAVVEETAPKESMYASSGSEYTDDRLLDQTDVTIELVDRPFQSAKKLENQAIEDAPKQIDKEDRQKAIEDARRALMAATEAKEVGEAILSVEDHKERAIEKTVNDLGEHEKEIRSRLEASWGSAPVDTLPSVMKPQQEFVPIQSTEHVETMENNKPETSELEQELAEDAEVDVVNDHSQDIDKTYIFNDGPGTAIPVWIHQIEKAVAAGSAPDLKKWQRDVLGAQHPDILKRYDSLTLSNPEHHEILSPHASMPSRSMSGLFGDELPPPVNQTTAPLSNRSYVPLPYNQPRLGDRLRSLIVPFIKGVNPLWILGGGVCFGVLLIAIFGK